MTHHQWEKEFEAMLKTLTVEGKQTKEQAGAQ